MEEKMENGILSKEDFEFIIEQSKIKNEKIISDTEHIFTKLMDKFYPEDKEKQIGFLEGFYNKIWKKIKSRLDDDIERGLYLKGERIIDPFFQCNFKCLFPVLKKEFFDANITTKEIKYRFGSVAINQYIREQIGGYYDEFLRLLQENIEEHRKKLAIKNIKQMKDAKIRGIARTIIIDILSQMKTYRKQMKSI